MTEDDATVVTREEFTRELARELNMDPEELRARSREFEFDPPWEAEIVSEGNDP